MSKKYFASLPVDKIGAELQKRVDAYYQYMRNSGMYDLLNYSHYQYYKAMVHKGMIRKTGNSYEYDLLYVNNFRTIGQRTMIMANPMVPTFRCRAANTDSKTQEQVKTGNTVIDHYYRETDYKSAFSRALEYGWYLGEGFIYEKWDTTKGKIEGYFRYNDDKSDFEIDEESGNYSLYDIRDDEGNILEGLDLSEYMPAYEGDISYYAKSPMDIIRDHTAYKYEDCNWKIIRSYVNRFALAKQYPEHESKIMSIMNENDAFRVLRNSNTNVESDYVALYEFYHEDDELCPGGLYVPFLNANTVLNYTGLGYKRIPLTRIAEGELENRPFGYSRAFDILPLQQAYDSIRSLIISNQRTLGGQTFTAEEGSNVDTVQLAEGLNVLYYGSGFNPPGILEKLKTPAEMFSTLEKILSEMYLLSGLNDTSMGMPQASITTASGLHLMNQLAIQNISTFQESVTAALEDSATLTLEILQQYADSPRFAKLVGENEKFMLTEWNRENIRDIRTVDVEIASPALRTFAGKKDVIDMFLNAGPDLGPKLLQVFQNNNLDFLTEGQDTENILISSENEELKRVGDVMPIVSPGDDHSLHIPDHFDELKNPEVRNDPEQVKRFLQHIGNHVIAWQSLAPDLAMAYGIKPYPAMMPPPAGQETPQEEAQEFTMTKEPELQTA